MKRVMTKRDFSLLLVLILMMGTIQTFAAALVAKDYENHWAKATIVSSLEAGLIEGYADGSFKPDQQITRAEFITLINRGFGFKIPANVTFNDVQRGQWYIPEIEKAMAAGYIMGYSDGSIRPLAPITRQEAAVIIQRIEGLTVQGQTVTFKDAKDIAPWGKTSVLALAEAKRMNGFPDGQFKPNAFLTRAEALVLVQNCLDASAMALTAYDKPGVYGTQAGRTTIAGDLRIDAAGVTIENTVVEGDLTIGKEVGDGEVTLKQVTVKGNLYVKGGGINSIYFIDVTTGKVYVERSEGPVRIVASGSSDINEILVRSDLKLEEIDLSGAGFDGITVEKVGDTGIEISLKGVACESVDIQGEGVLLKTDAASTISVLTVDVAGTKVIGTGQIEAAVINSNDVTFEKAPVVMTVAPNVTAPEVTSPGPAVTVVSEPIEEREQPVRQISISASTELTRVAKGYTLQMVAAVTPSDADNRSIVWSTVPGTGTATISTSGVLTGTAFGTVTVKATNPATGVSGTYEIEVTEWDYTLSGNNATLTRYGGAGGVVTVPALIDGHPVTTLGKDVMANKQAITGVLLPDSLTTIGIGSFYGCSGMTAVDFGSGVLTIGEASFANCTALTTLDFPSQLQTIQDNAFAGCSGLYAVTFGDQLTGLGENAFERTALITVSLPDGITTVSNGLFGGCASLTSVTLSDRTTRIGYSAFEGCVSLDGVLFPESLEVIGDSAFSATGLTAITLPDSLRAIGEGAFGNCSGLTSVDLGLGVVTIGDYAFVYDPLTTLSIPNSVMVIGDGAFLESGLTAITIPDTVNSLGSQVFQGCTQLTTVTLGAGITAIPDYAFGGCSALTAIALPDGVTTIEQEAFSGCSGLLSVAFGDQLTTIGENAFYECGLTSLMIGDSVQMIDASAFQGCGALTTVTFGTGVNVIRNNAFLGCPLVSAYFEGNAPAVVANSMFGGESEGFVIYRHIGSTGFDTETEPWSFYTLDYF